MYSGAPSYHTLKANNGLYLSKQANVPEMRLWVIQRGETVKGFDAVNTLSVLAPTTRR